MNELKEKYGSYFEAYPNEEVIHITSDGTVFLNKNMHDGKNHQLQLDASQKLVTVYRKQLEEVVKEEENKEDALTPDETWKNADIVEWLNKELATIIQSEEEKIEVKGNETKAVLLEKVIAVMLIKDDAGSDD
jgi:hypothetical protein